MRRLAILTFWLFADILVFVGGFALAYFWRVGWIFSSDFPFDRYIAVVAMVSPFTVLALLLTRTFSLTRSQASARNIGYIAYANVLGTALFSLAYYFVYGLFFS